MRFFLDNDVDTAVATALRRRRHDVWTAAEAGLADAADDDLSVYADSKAAALLTHDAEFTTRRRAEPIGQHVRLACPEWDAAAILVRHLPALLVILSARKPVTVLLTRDAGPRILERRRRG